jgi:hypothetical protein
MDTKTNTTTKTNTPTAPLGPIHLATHRGYHGGGTTLVPGHLDSLVAPEGASLVGTVYRSYYHGDGDWSNFHEGLFLTLEGALVISPLAGAKDPQSLEYDLEALPRAHKVHNALVKAQKDKEEEALYQEQRYQYSYPGKGQVALILTGDNQNKLGRVFWVGESTYGGGNPNWRSRYSSGTTVVKLGLDVGGARNEKGYCADPTWTAQSNCLTVPTDVAQELESGDLGASPLASALSTLVRGLVANNQRPEALTALEGVLGDHGTVARLRALGADLLVARADLNTAKGLTKDTLPTNPSTGKKWTKKALVESREHGVLAVARAILQVGGQE